VILDDFKLFTLTGLVLRPTVSASEVTIVWRYRNSIIIIIIFIRYIKYIKYSLDV